MFVLGGAYEQQGGMKPIINILTATLYGQKYVDSGAIAWCLLNINEIITSSFQEPISLKEEFSMLQYTKTS